VVLVSPNRRSPAQQQGRGAQRLGVLDLGPLLEVLAPVLGVPAAPAEALLTVGVLDYPVERYVRADDDLSILGLLLADVVSCQRPGRVPRSSRAAWLPIQTVMAAPGSSGQCLRHHFGMGFSALGRALCMPPPLAYRTVLMGRGARCHRNVLLIRCATACGVVADQDGVGDVEGVEPGAAACECFPCC
jgi:hypothetical protein